MDTKQVIVIRRDLKLRRGKEIAQGAHASLGWLTRRLKPGMMSEVQHSDPANDTDWLMYGRLTVAEKHWLDNGTRKITCQVPDLAALEAVARAARDAGVECHVVIDAGHTEIPAGTVTALAVGPGWDEDIDKVTGHLALY